MEDMRYQFLNVLADIGFVDKSRNQQVIYILYEVGALQSSLSATTSWLPIVWDAAETLTGIQLTSP